MPLIDNQNTPPEDDGCEACHSEVADLEAYPSHRYFVGNKIPIGATTHKWLCALCASTMAGNAREYPEQYPDREILFAICFVGNAILKEIRDAKV